MQRISPALIATNSITASGRFLRPALFCCVALVTLFAPASMAAEPVKPDFISIRIAFIEDEEFATNLRRLLELEAQALVLMEDEPLKLGSIGAAILEIYAGSQTGHRAMIRYYEHVDAEDAGRTHAQHLMRIQGLMRASGDGSPEHPFLVMTRHDAHSFTQDMNATPVGAIYQSSENVDLGLMLVSRPEKAKLRQAFYDLTHTLKAFDLSDSEHDDQTVHPWAAIRMLAAEMDSAAQTAIGAYLTNIQKYEDAIGWLKVASRTGNVLANSLLARIYWTQSESEEDNESADELRELSLENHLHAIALGSTDSMYTLANLYLNDFYGEENRSSAIPLLEQAGGLGHVEALIYLGHLYNTGQNVSLDKDRAATYFEQAAGLDNVDAILNYGRFALGQRDATKDYRQLHEWLTRLANDRNPEAMIVLGNLLARGIGTEQSNRKAIRWYKKAVSTAPENPDIVNEVVWTLTVSDIDGLKRTRYAKRSMDRLMNGVAEAREWPEYLDTWAATHAARGDFERAIELQEQAIEAARNQQREDVLDILTTHLEKFRAGSAIVEPAP